MINNKQVLRLELLVKAHIYLSKHNTNRFVSFLAHSLRYWANIKPTLAPCLVFGDSGLCWSYVRLFLGVGRLSGVIVWAQIERMDRRYIFHCDVQVRNNDFYLLFWVKQPRGRCDLRAPDYLASHACVSGSNPLTLRGLFKEFACFFILNVTRRLC